MGSKGGRQAYFDAAMAILAEHGDGGLTQAALCERLYVTTGAFYYHFDNMDGFRAALVAEWESDFADIIAAVGAEPDPVRKLEMLAEEYLLLRLEAEAAIRGWGKTDERVAAALSRVDAGVQAVIAAALSTLVADPVRGELLAYMTLSLAIGVQQRDDRADHARTAAAFAEWYRVLLGLDTEFTTVGGRARVRFHRSTTPSGEVQLG